MTRAAGSSCRLCSALATALATTLATGSLALCGGKRSSARASSVGRERGRGTTPPALLGGTRADPAVARAAGAPSPHWEVICVSLCPSVLSVSPDGTGGRP